MGKGVGAILFIASIAAACAGGSTAPTSAPNTRSAGSLGAGGSTQSTNAGVEITGTVDALPPTTAAGTFMTAGNTVITNASTTFASSGVPRAFADLKLGMKVEVHGTISGNTITATRVDLEDEVVAPNPNPEPEPEPEPHNPNPPSPPSPTPPVPIPTPPSPGDGDDNQGNEAEVEGTLGMIAGTCPSISSTVGATKFATTASTKFDDVACTALTPGSKVQVKGTRNADGSIMATRVQRD